MMRSLTDVGFFGLFLALCRRSVLFKTSTSPRAVRTSAVVVTAESDTSWPGVPRVVAALVFSSSFSWVALTVLLSPSWQWSVFLMTVWITESVTTAPLQDRVLRWEHSHRMVVLLMPFLVYMWPSKHNFLVYMWPSKHNFLVYMWPSKHNFCPPRMLVIISIVINDKVTCIRYNK